MEKERTQTKNRTNLRDSLIIVVFLVLSTAAYFIITERPNAAQNDFNHPDIGQGQGGMPDFEQMISSLPGDYEPLVQMGNQFMDNAVYPMAIECYRRALAIDSSEVNVRVDLGACLHAAGDVVGALKVFKQAILLEPDHAIAHFNLGIAYTGIDSMKMAADAWRKYLELDPNAPLRDTVQNFIKMIEQGQSHGTN